MDVHMRFEHSLGVYRLAGEAEAMNKLKKTQVHVHRYKVTSTSQKLVWVAGEVKCKSGRWQAAFAGQGSCTYCGVVWQLQEG